tara:strand:- start:203 stop:352 length:150 start_codon:yes stop_codon:yes gene_type:complete
MIKKTTISTKSLHKKKIRDFRIKKLEKRMKFNIIKRKKNIKNNNKTKNG